MRADCANKCKECNEFKRQVCPEWIKKKIKIAKQNVFDKEQRQITDWE